MSGLDENVNKEKITFVIQILSCQNATWQGRITWTDKQVSQNFRSALEMIKLIDSSINIRTEEKKYQENV